jgi:signal transduction histidine kinase
LGRVRCAFRGGATVADPAIAAHLFRIAQEATSNAFRHAQPTHVTIRLTRHTGRLRLEIRDDGVGLPAGAWQNKGRGLRSMQYRAQLIHADLTISRHRNSGTIVTCSLSAPYANRRA